MLSLEVVVVTSSVDLSMAHGDPNHLFHVPRSLHQVAQTGALHASHNAQAQHLPQQPVSPAWTTRHVMAQGRQDQSRERVDSLDAVGHPRDREASQRPLPSVRPHELDLSRVLSPENRALLLMRNTTPMRWLQIEGIWMNLSGISHCVWSLRDATVKINIRKDPWNNLHGMGQLKKRYMKVARVFCLFVVQCSLILFHRHPTRTVSAGVSGFWQLP